jgi:hypothetical protein
MASGGAEGVVTTIPPAPKEIKELKLAIGCWARNTTMAKIQDPSMDAALCASSASCVTDCALADVFANSAKAKSEVTRCKVLRF